MLPALMLIAHSSVAADERAAATQAGSVTTPAGAAIAGACVRLQACRDRSEQHQAESAEDGTFLVRGLASPYYDIEVSKPEFVTWRSGTAAGVSCEHVVLAPQARLAGRVQDRESARPLRELAISWHGPRPGAQFTEDVLVACAPDGRFDVGVDPGTYVFRFAAVGFADAVLAPVVLNSSSGHHLQAIELAPAHRVAGRIVDARGGRVSAAIVKCYDPARRFVSARHTGWTCELPSGDRYHEALVPNQVVMTRADGSFSFAWPSERCELVVLHAAFVPRFVAADLTSDRDLGDLILHRGGDVVGRVRSASGAPVAGAVVRAADASAFSSARATCDALGSFALHRLAPGTWTLIAETVGGSARLQARWQSRCQIMVVEGASVAVDLCAPPCR
ncbi:MAG: carboxypeptidase-like regulatory domain-containing protein [Planctomycetota bacterium]